MNNLQTSEKLFSDVLDLKRLEENSAVNKFNAILKENDHLPGRVAMDIYRNTSIGARQKALQLIYPVVEKILGESCFTMMTNDFVTASPSLDADLNNYGEAFPAFLADQVSVNKAFEDFQYLPDLALLEWFYHAAYYAADDAAIPDLSAAVQSGTNGRSLRLSCSRSLFCLDTTFPVYEIWQNHQGDNGVFEVAALAEEDYLLIYRRQNHPHIERISRPESILLQSLAVSQDAESMIDAMSGQGIDVQQLLPEMTEKGWVRIEMK